MTLLFLHTIRECLGSIWVRLKGFWQKSWPNDPCVKETKVTLLLGDVVIMDECLSLFFVQTLNGVTRTRTQEARPDLRRANTNLQKIIDQPKRAKVHQLEKLPAFRKHPPYDSPARGLPFEASGSSRSIRRPRVCSRNGAPRDGGSMFRAPLLM